MSSFPSLAYPSDGLADTRLSRLQKSGKATQKKNGNAKEQKEGDDGEEETAEADDGEDDNKGKSAKERQSEGGKKGAAKVRRVPPSRSAHPLTASLSQTNAKRGAGKDNKEDDDAEEGEDEDEEMQDGEEGDDDENKSAKQRQSEGGKKGAAKVSTSSSALLVSRLILIALFRRPTPSVAPARRRLRSAPHPLKAVAATRLVGPPTRRRSRTTMTRSSTRRKWTMMTRLTLTRTTSPSRRRSSAPEAGFVQSPLLSSPVPDHTDVPRQLAEGRQGQREVEGPGSQEAKDEVSARCS